jgi:hypothetical protein
MASDEFSALLIDERVIGNMLDGQIHHRGHDLHCVDLRSRGDRTHKARLASGSKPATETGQDHSYGSEEPEFAHWRPLLF